MNGNEQKRKERKETDLKEYQKSNVIMLFADASFLFQLSAIQGCEFCPLTVS
jgi:hypothetical protein